MFRSDGVDDLAGVLKRRGSVCVRLAQSLPERAECFSFSLPAWHLREDQTTGVGKSQKGTWEKCVLYDFVYGSLLILYPNDN